MDDDNELRLRIIRGAAGAYEIRAAGIPASVPLGINPGGGDVARAVVGIGRGTASDAEIERFGTDLFRGLFVGELNDAYRARQAAAELRIVLDLGADEALHALPWTYLFDPVRRVFLAADIGERHTTLALEVDIGPAGAPVRGAAWQMLIISADPHGTENAIAVEPEVAAIQHVLEEAGQPPAEHLAHATLDKLTAVTQGSDSPRRPHVVHFMAHGEAHETGSRLLLEDGVRYKDPIPANVVRDNLRFLLPSLRLVVLNVCDSYDLARDIAQLGVAAIGCRARINQEPALSLATALYRELAKGRTVDAALNVARLAVKARHARQPRDWGLPVLFLPGGDARPFRLPARRGGSSVSPGPAIVRVRTDVVGATVTLLPTLPDGSPTFLGTTDDAGACDAPLVPGTHRLRVAAAGFETVERTVSAAPGAQEEAFALRELPSAPPGARAWASGVRVSIAALVAVTVLVVAAAAIVRWARPNGTVAIAGGSFVRGAPQTPLSRLLTEYLDFLNLDRSVVQPPPGPASVPQAYAIDRFEVTAGAYKRFIDAIGGMHKTCHPDEPPQKAHRPEKAADDAPSLPVVGIDWWDAWAYCAWVGARLPTGDEWERAARGTDGRWYAWGNEFRPGLANTAETRQGGRAPVGSFADDRSPDGVFDLVGNVAEWTDETMRMARGRPDLHAVRGAGFTGAGALYGLAFFRNFPDPMARPPDVGFRCARSLPPTAEQVAIPAGKFIRGSEDSEFINLLRDAQLRGDAFRAQFVPRPSPGHVRAYRIDRDEITNAQYREYLAVAGSHTSCHPDEQAGKDHTPKFWSDARYNADDQPVVGVDWFDAYSYARWAQARLPTEDEWERAARGIDGRRYPWGDEYRADVCLGRESRPAAAALVTSPTADETPEGVRHLGGNVTEWTDGEQRFENDVYRVLRGAAWTDPCKLVGLTFFRNVGPPGYRGPEVGFRCVR